MKAILKCDAAIEKFFMDDLKRRAPKIVREIMKGVARVARADYFDHKGVNMTSIEKARKIVSQGDCSGFMCRDGEEPCPMVGKHVCNFPKEPCNIQWFKKWLAEHDPEYKNAEIIGWPGNAEEMRKYIGRLCVGGPNYNCTKNETRHMGNRLQDVIPGSDEPYKVIDQWWRFLKIFPEPEVKEYTIQEIADKFGVPVESVRIKDQ